MNTKLAEDIHEERQRQLRIVSTLKSQKEIHNWAWDYIELVRQEIEARYGKLRSLDGN